MHDPALSTRLRTHVEILAGTIGERNVSRPGHCRPQPTTSGKPGATRATRSYHSITRSMACAAPIWSDSPHAHDRFYQKLSFLADAISSLDPDIVALHELGSNALATLQGTLGTAAYPDAQEGVPDGCDIRVGFLSRLPYDVTPENIVAFTGHHRLTRSFD